MRDSQVIGSKGKKDLEKSVRGEEQQIGGYLGNQPNIGTLFLLLINPTSQKYR